MPEEIETLIRLKLIQQFTNKPPKLTVSAFRRLAQERLQLSKDLLDRIQVRTLGRQVFDRRPVRFNNVLDFRHLMRRQSVIGRILISLHRSLCYALMGRSKQETNL